MDDVIGSMECTYTWSVVPLLLGYHVIGCKWVFRVKNHTDGTVDRYKARLVAKWYNQQEGIDFIDAFSPVAKIVTIKVLLTLSASFSWHVVQMDVNNAFLNGDLVKEAYMSLPLGYKPLFVISNKGSLLLANCTNLSMD